MKIFRIVVCITLALAFLISCIIVQGTGSAQKDNVWDGSIATAFSGGKGTQSNPYLISNGAEFALAVKEYNKYWNKYFCVTEDIYLNDINKINFLTGEPEDGYTPNSWIALDLPDSNSGWIDGNGHVIYGLYINSPQSTKNAALFPYTYAGLKINDLGIDCAYINTSGNAAAFIAYHKNINSTKSSFENCFVGENVKISGNTAAGFIAAGEGTANFKNSYSAANLNATNVEGGFTGDTANLTVTADNCYSTTKFDGGNCTKLTFKNCYCTEQSAEGLTALPDSRMKKTVGEGNKMVLGRDFVATETYPVLKVFQKNYSDPWNGLAEYITKGSGTNTDPYLIENAGHLAYAVGIGGGSHYYKFTGNIYINDIDKINWKSGRLIENTGYRPRPWFTGTTHDCASYKSILDDKDVFYGNVDANGYSVYGLWYPTEMTEIASGLIPSARKTTVKNLTLSYSFVVGGRFVGAVSSCFGGELNGVFVDDTVTVCAKQNAEEQPSFSVCAGVGYSVGITLRNCGTTASLISYTGETYKHTYGLVGTSWGTKIYAENCYSLGYQPFTTSLAIKNFDSETDANNYKSTYDSLYTLNNVYTDTVKRTNTIAYTYDSDGIDTDGDGSFEYDVAVNYEDFTFTKLDSAQFKGADALENLSGFTADNWVTGKSAPILRTRSESLGDVDADGEYITEKDILLMRKFLVGAENLISADTNRSGSADVCDLVDITLRKDDVRVYRTYIAENPVVYTNASADVANYSIIYPEKDAKAKALAEKLANSFAKAGLKLAVLPDSAQPYDKEILIGNTNRGTIKTNLSENRYETHMSGEKIFIQAGSDIALSSAVHHLTKLPISADTFRIINGYANIAPEITLSNGKTYSYVWGDEFSGRALDYTKWTDTVSGTNMGPCNAPGKPADIAVLSNSSVISVADGRLRLTPILYTDPDNENIKYGVPASVRTRDKMAYRYGYAEIRAKVPFKTGLWPSFWTGCSKSFGERNCLDYRVEVDIFEIFGSSNTVVPQIHKWYEIDRYDYNAIHGTSVENNHTQGPSSIRKTYVYENYENLSNEYHTYGFEWTPTEMSMYVDGYCYNTYDITKSYDLCEDMSGFHDARYIIFNNHVFSPNSNFKPNCIEGYEDNLPANYDIDYFRLYQSDEYENTELWVR